MKRNTTITSKQNAFGESETAILNALSVYFNPSRVISDEPSKTYSDEENLYNAVLKYFKLI